MTLCESNVVEPWWQADIEREDAKKQSLLPSSKLLLTIPEAGAVLSVSRSKIYGLMNSGDLPSVLLGRSRRIRVSDLEQFVGIGASDE
jgi:excisionase family DNA binding protein